MKQIITTIVLSLCLSQAMAQDSLRKIRLGIDLTYAKPTVFKAGFFPSISLSIGKQVFFAGPSVIYYDQEHLTPLTGAQGGYKVFPYGSHKRFSLFFEFNFNYVQGKLKDNIRRVPSDYYWRSSAGDRTIHHVSIDNYFGFGFRWNMFRNFHFASGMDLGLGLYKQDYTYTFDDGTTWSNKGKLQMREVTVLNTIFKMGIGFNIPTIKKRK